MERVGDDGCPVVEDHLVARAAREHAGGGDDPRRAPVRVEEVLPDADLSHRGPARRGGQGGVEGEGLSHGRSGRDDDHLAGVQAVGELVELAEARGHAVHPLGAGLHLLQLGDGVLHDLRQWPVVVAGLAVGDGVDLGLGEVDDLVDVPALAGVAERRDLRPGLHQATQDRLVADDPGVVRRAGRGRHGGHQRVQVRRTAHPVQLAAPPQDVRHRDRVRGLTASEQVQDGVVDHLVRGAVEVRALEVLAHVRDGVLGQQHGAERALLGQDVLRRHPLEPAGTALLAGTPPRQLEVHRRLSDAQRSTHFLACARSSSRACTEVVARTPDRAGR